MPVLSVAGVRGLKSHRKLREASETSSASSIAFYGKGEPFLSAKNSSPLDTS